MAKKKTNEEFIKEVYNLVGNEYIFLEEYKGNKTKIRVKHNCKKCNNHEYIVKPNLFLTGGRCPKCFGNIKKTTQEFKNEVYSLVNNEYEVLGEYINSKTKIKMRHNCKNCNSYEYEVLPSEFLVGKRCPKCFGNIKKTTQEFKDEVYSLVNDEYEVLSEYINNKTKIKIRHNCKECNNYEYKVAPSHFLSGRRCPKCFSTKQKTTQEWIKEVYSLVGDEYIVLENYSKSNIKIKMKHNNQYCNHKFEMRPNDFIKGSRCPKCFGNIKKTTQEFKDEVYSLVNNEYEVLGEYINNKTKIKIRHNCKKCNNYEYEASPNDFLSGYRCPKCNESKGEKAISNYLDLKKIPYKKEYKFKDCKDKDFLRFDFTIFDNKDNFIGIIEFDGEQHFKLGGFGAKDKEKIKENFRKIQLRDSIKNKYCEDNNIPLLRIKYTQFDIIEEVLNDFLENPTQYIKNHSYNLTNEEYYKKEASS